MNLSVFVPLATEFIKQRFKSKTHRFAGIVALSPLLYESVPPLKDLLDQHYNWAVLLLAAGIAILRELTSESVSDKK